MPVLRKLVTPAEAHESPTPASRDAKSRVDGRSGSGV